MHFIRYFISIVLLFLVSNFVPVLGQDTNRVRKNLQKLCSQSFAGRGYLKNGHLKAAAFLENQFRHSGLKPVGGKYFQQLEFSQNLFPSNTTVLVNKKVKKPGLDFLPVPGCPSVNRKFKLVWLDSLAVLELEKRNGRSFPNEAWVAQVNPKTKRRLEEMFSPGLWISTELKLTHSLSQNQSKIPSLVFLKGQITPSDTVLEISLRAIQKEKIKSKNIIGMVPGNLFPDSFLVVCGHYDHLGMLGKKVFFPGANDNASGTSLLLELADWYAHHSPKYSVVFIAFTGEEAGLLGSSYFVKNPMIQLDKIKFLVNLDLLGYGEKGATVVNATLHSEAFERLKHLNARGNYLSDIKARGKAANSDHYPFSEAGVPAFFLYTLGGPGHYHDVFDKPETVNLKFFPASFSLVRDFLDSF